MKNSFVFGVIGATVVLAVVALWWAFSRPSFDYSKLQVRDTDYWVPPGTWSLPANDSGRLIRYGRELVAHTALYYGPKGSISRTTNGMNCQNCHLDAGTKMWGNNFSAVQSCYPKFRERRGAVEGVVQRIEDCFVRSLAGKPIDSNGREMKAIIAYMKWLGTDVKKGVKPEGAGIRTLAYIDRAADTNNGRTIYNDKCRSCHQPDGQGLLAFDGREYTYPPLWGEHSYNTGAGMYRLERLAGFVKNNMPLGTSYASAQLTDEEAWDVAAFINSRPRHLFDIAGDYPDIGSKPVDYPYAPYTDTFSERQHKYGPFGPIKRWKENNKKKS